ncbi:TonB-dependent siderophore receptor [Bowmanella denitrificans]|uniref:TonB-dependent siderophore receptor n=1 Tax=Bowmanella denitrificans TaxID=366582 RepID=UPI00155972FE|nr:TonB-dependent receptor [Bowmanella denitrificans]
MAAPETRAASFYQFDLQQGSLSQCLNTIAQTADIYIAVDSRLIANKACTGFSLSLSAEQALARVLSESGLYYQQMGDTHYVVKGEDGAFQEQPGPTEIRVSFSLPDKNTTLFTPLPDWQEVKSQSSGIGQSVKQTPQTVSLLNPKVFQSFNQTDLGEVLRLSPGIYSTSSSRTGNREFRARGNILNPFLIDGQPFADANFAVSELDSAYFHLFEVNRGTNGIQQDNGINSASVNLLPKPAIDKALVDISASHGELLSHRLSADLGGSLISSGALQGRLVLVEQKKQDAAEHSNRLRQGGFARLGWQLANMTKLDFYHIEQRDTQRQQSTIRPLLYSDTTPYDGPLSTNFWPSWSGRKQHLVFSQVAVQHQLSANWQANLALSKGRQYSSMLFTEPYGYPDVQSLTIAFGAYRQILDFQADKSELALTGKVLLYTLPMDLSVAMSSTSNHSQQHIDLMEYDGLSSMEPGSYKVKERDQSAPETVLDRYINVLRYQIDSVKLASRISLTESTQLSASVRHNRSRYHVDSTLLVERDSSSYNNLYLGISQSIGDAQLYANYADIVDFRSGYISMLDIILLPNRFVSTELGIKVDLWQRQGQLSISTYQSQPKRFGFTTDLGYAKQAGWEAELTYQKDALQLSLAYARQHSTELINTNVQFPENLYRLTLGYSLAFLSYDMMLGAAVEGESRQDYLLPSYVDRNQIPVSQPASWRLNAYYKWQVSPNTTLTFSLKNVLDKGYFDGVDVSRGWASYGAPRQLTLTFDQHF